MKIYIELVIVLFLMLMFIFWKLWYDLSRRRILKKYNKENDITREPQNGKGNKGGIFAKTEQGAVIGTTEPGIEPAPISPNGSEESRGRELLPETVADDVREDSSSTGKGGTNIRRRRFFRRRRRK